MVGFPVIAAGCSTVVAVAVASENHVSKFLANYIPTLFEDLKLPVSRLYGGVMLINVVESCAVLQYLAHNVGAARSKCKEDAKKAGDTDAEARYSYPKLYAEGFSKEARQFNQAQRSHQHALETYPAFLALSFVAGVHFPIATLIAGGLWNTARVAFAMAYTHQGAADRYNLLSFQIWTSSFVLFGLACVSAVKMMANC
eukprot:Platyproteum_vivax@DN4775_c0_g1_i1.p1